MMAEPVRKALLVTWDLDGWQAIADALGVPVRTAKRWADLEGDPLPVTRMMAGGGVKARTAQVQAWVDRRFAKAHGGAP